jgi:hypothetical protein
MNTIINLKKVLLITAIPLLFAASCKKENSTKPCVGNAYIFATTSNWSLQREIYNIGDTIFLNSSFSKNLNDLVGNYNVDYSNSTGINGSITLFELDSIQHLTIDAVEKFNFTPISGNISNNNNKPARIKDYLYQELTNIYSFKLGIIPKSKGIYTMFISDLTSQGIVGKNCTNASFTNTLTNSNKNINLFQYAMNRPPASQFEIDRIYCFRVQ